MIFWVSEFTPDLKSASLTDGSNITTMRLRIRRPSKKIRHFCSLLKFIFTPISAGVAVDWINDKVYWADSTSDTISFYDLHTKMEGKVANIPPNSIPGKIKIFPQIDGG